MDIMKLMDGIARLEAEIKDSVELMIFTIAKGEPDGVVEFDTAKGPVRTSGALSDDEVMDALSIGEAVMPFRQLTREDKYLHRAYDYLDKARGMLEEAFRGVLPSKGKGVTVESGGSASTVRLEDGDVVCEQDGETTVLVPHTGVPDPFRALPILEKVYRKIEDEKII